MYYCVAKWHVINDKMIAMWQKKSCIMFTEYSSPRGESRCVSNRGSKIVIQTESWVRCIVTALFSWLSSTWLTESYNWFLLRQKGNSMKTLYSPRGMNPVVISASFHAWKTVHLSCNVLPSTQISTVQYSTFCGMTLSKLFLSRMFLPLYEEILLKAFTSSLKPGFFF